MANSKSRGWTAWSLCLAVALPILYVASFGPACWWCSRISVSGIPVAPGMYGPIGYLANRFSETSLFNAISWYATLKSPVVAVSTSRPGTTDSDGYIILYKAGAMSIPFQQGSHPLSFRDDETAESR